jgi:hypothetical protein
MSQDEVCASNTTVDVLYCDGDLMYRFSDNKIWSLDYIGRVYICFGTWRKYTKINFNQHSINFKQYVRNNIIKIYVLI